MPSVTLDSLLNVERVLVCGGREYANRRRVHKILFKILPKRLAQGGARGADAHAREWAEALSVPCDTFAADWERNGKAAGPIRNVRMLTEFKPTLVVAFPGGVGTEDMVRRAERADVPVLRIPGFENEIGSEDRAK